MLFANSVLHLKKYLMIKVTIRHEETKYAANPDEQDSLNKFVNELLEPIQWDCIAYGARVDVVRTYSNNYKFVANCEQYSTLVRMQHLLPEVLPIEELFFG
jgi:hypothetical protein